MKRGEVRVEAGITQQLGVGIVGDLLLVERVHLGLRCGERHSGSEASDHLIVVAVPVVWFEVVGPVRSGAEEAGAAREETKVGRQYPEDGDGKTVVEELFSDDGGVGVEMRAPERVGQYGDLVGGVGHFRIGEALPSREWDAERGEELGRDACDRDTVGRAVAADDHAAVLKKGNGREGFDGLTAIVVVDGGSAGTFGSGARVGLVDGDKTVRFGERQRPDEDGVDHGENRDVGADAEGERQKNREGETAFLEESAESLTQKEEHDRKGVGR